MSGAVLPTTADVLVVGAGPTGLALTTALRQLGVDAVEIDLATEIRQETRAAGVQPRTLETLARLGCADALVAKGLRGTGFHVATQDEPLLDISFAGLDTPYPFVLQVPQDQTERVLRQALADAGGEVLAGHRLLSLENEFDAVTALVAAPDGGVRVIRARYLVGCDGLHSGVRARAGIGFGGEDRPETFALADVRVKEPIDVVRVEFTFSPEGMLLRSALPDDVVRIVATVAETGADTGVLDQAGLQQLIDRRLGPHSGTEIAEVIRSGPYQVSSRLAQSFSRGRVFLAGDAAHVHSPAGGQGMNTGIQDAVNLAWKLAAVLGGGEASLLDSYDAERRPNAAALLAFTGQLTNVAEMKDPAMIALRNDVLRAVQDVSGLSSMLAGRLSQVDVNYRRPDDDRPEPVGRRAPHGGPASGLAWSQVRLDDGRTARVRPDGYVDQVS